MSDEKEEDNGLVPITGELLKFSKDSIKDKIDERIKEVWLPDRPRDSEKLTGINDALAEGWVSLYEKGMSGGLDPISDALFIKVLKELGGLFDYNNKEKVVKHELNMPSINRDNINKM